MAKVWTIIRRSGRADVLTGSDSPGSPSYSYLDVLKFIHGLVYRESGSDCDAPTLLLRDGVVVIEEGLVDVAFAYEEELDKEIAEARSRVNAKHVREFGNG